MTDQWFNFHAVQGPGIPARPPASNGVAAIHRRTVRGQNHINRHRAFTACADREDDFIVMVDRAAEWNSVPQDKAVVELKMGNAAKYRARYSQGSVDREWNDGVGG